MQEKLLFYGNFKKKYLILCLKRDLNIILSKFGVKKITEIANI